MRERGILFSAPMVRAVLAGTKTQTRRIVKPQPDWDSPKPCCETTRDGFQGAVNRGMWSCGGTWTDDEDPRRCPYGQPGDRLYVKEAHQFVFRYKNVWCRYGADGHFCSVQAPHIPSSLGRRRPSIHMPRWASRLTLEITDVRVERLNEISDLDAQSEGVALPAYHRTHQPTAIDVFRELWESINGPGSWAANPWVWVIAFRRLP